MRNFWHRVRWYGVHKRAGYCDHGMQPVRAMRRDEYPSGDPEDVARWQAEQAAKAIKAKFYGGSGTIHQTGYVDVETRGGRVVAVWYRCRMLPFAQHEVERDRARAMDEQTVPGQIEGITFAP